ncbi:A-kinase anchor protein 12b isoform X2 [Etheostoma spectabile]|uniref:A-kinase anchor protein 12b isoform X2 n=1 Tax=Etheostoma spectabile TaxID=54343 RepID=UPI0013AFDADA|nr:A-kinase anchor protein 12 isoform X2 [Etheostoma spectabile]
MLGTITLTVGQPDGVAQKEEASDTVDTIQGDVAPQLNGEKVEKESPDANDISAIEEKAAEEKPDDASEVGFKKIFRFVGFKFTLKKDKSEEKDPVKLLTIKDKGEEEEEVTRTDEPMKEEEAATLEEKSTAEEKEADTVESTAETEVSQDKDKAETTDDPAEVPAAEAIDEAVKDEGAEKEGETTLSPFRKLFSGGLFSNLRKKASIKKTKEEEDKEAAVEKETAKTEETAAVVEEKVEKDEVEQEAKEEAPATPEELKPETIPEPEVTVETPAAGTTEETKQEGEKAEPSAEEKAPTEVTSEAELLSSQEKAKPQGSPLKKLFGGAGLKKLSTKKQKTKKDTETKLTESGEQASEQLQSSTESAEAPKTDSGPSSPEESGEHVIAVEVTQNESSQETDGEVASDGEKKKEGIIAWSSFKKLVTPKKRVKRSSESEDEATGEKPAKSATLSSSESAPLADKSVEEEDKEDKPTEEEPKTENTEKLVSSTEEPKKKMDTSVSWEALMCMGGPKKRTRRTSDSDDEETKVEEESTAAVEGEQEGKTEAAIVTSQTTESDGEFVSSSEPLGTPPDKESTWDTLKRMVMPKNKAKNEEKPEETPEQCQSDSEAPKDESSFSLRKLFPVRRKKKTEKQASTEPGSGEEDSDTPAVVPLSEYDDQVTAEQDAPAEPAEVQIKESTEDRSPSWIPATVEDGDDQHDQLSDIPEEAENAATPKSVDTDIAEDETEDKDNMYPKATKSTGRRLSTAEVKPVAPAPSANTTLVQGTKPESAEEVIEGVKAQISEIPPQTNVTVEDLPVEVVSEKIECEPPTENAESKTITLLKPHARDEAMAICTGLDTKEIAEVALEKPVMPVVACVAVIHDAVSTEVSVEENTVSTKAIATEDAVLNAQVHQVETTKFESIVESSQGGLDIQAAKENHEPEIVKAGIFNTVQEEAEIIQPTTMSQNCINAVIVDPITPTSEPDVCTQSVEVTEPTIETKEVQMNVEQLAAAEKNTVKEVAQYVTKEVASTICETTKTTNTEETEPAILVVPSQEVSVITQTVVLVAPVSAATTPMATMENAPLSESVGNEPIQVEEETVEETVETAQTAESEISSGTEQSSEKMEDVQQTSEIEAQSIVIAQAVIQDAMDKVSEDTPESKKSTTPTPVQAVATTEKEIEITTEGPVITETPVAVCEKAAPKSPQLLCVAMEVIDTIPVEVTESIDVSVEEQKPEEKLKKAVEVNVSEETVVVEEVVEIKTESQIGEELEQVKEEQSKDDAEVQKPDVKEAAEEVEPQSEEAKAETPAEETKERVLDIHMPVQMVLQTAQVFEEPSVEEEAVEEFDSNGPVAEDIELKAEIAASESKLSTLSEEPREMASAEASSPSQVTEADKPETPSGKCAEVMAQVIEVIEEAVKEIEPVSTEITAAS